MAEDDSQERTQSATQKRIKELRDQGQVLRSRELNRVLVTFSGGVLLYFSAHHVFETFQNVSQNFFVVTQSDLVNDLGLLSRFGTAITTILYSFLPFFLVIFLFILLSPMLLGGFILGGENLSLKFARLDPIKGIQRMFSLNSLIELAKAIAKFILILVIGIAVLWWQIDKIMGLSELPTTMAIVQGFYILAVGFFAIGSALIIIAGIDVPYQIWEYMQKSKMTHREIKDEAKETDGNPQVKQRIRQLQLEISKRRMMEAVPKASVIITNPEHYAVALQYDQNKDHAPKVLAKGLDLIAQRIIEIARENKITLFRAPPLARALYFNSKLGEEIPAGLYVAVAKVLAYIYQLKYFWAGYATKPRDIGDNELVIPKEFQHE